MMRLELAAEYLVMAAILAEIKSRLLLPRPPERGRTGRRSARRAGAPPAGIRTIQAGRRGHRRAAPAWNATPSLVHAYVPRAQRGQAAAAGGPARNAAGAARTCCKRAELFGHHAIKREALACASAWATCWAGWTTASSTASRPCSTSSEGRLGVVVTFLAMLELAKEQLLEIVQEEPLAPIYVKVRCAIVSAGD